MSGAINIDCFRKRVNKIALKAIEDRTIQKTKYGMYYIVLNEGFYCTIDFNTYKMFLCGYNVKQLEYNATFIVTDMYCNLCGCKNYCEDRNDEEDINYNCLRLHTKMYSKEDTTHELSNLYQYRLARQAVDELKPKFIKVLEGL